MKGFEVAKNQYVQFTGEELMRSRRPSRTPSIWSSSCRPRSVDLIYVSKTYYLGPDKGGDKAYRLLTEAMERTERIAVGRYRSHGKEQLVLLRPYKKGLMLHYVYYANEVRSYDDVDTGATVLQARRSRAR